MCLGLAHALLAGIRRDRIINFMEREELLAWVSEVRDQAGALIHH
jgi:hypothetical protein